MKTLFLALIRFYQKYISSGRAPCCRFRPTCSQYALQAIEKYGALKGGWLALRRLAATTTLYPEPIAKRLSQLFDPVP